MSFTSERGAAELLYSQPVSRATILSGQMLGVFVALVAAQLVGFGAAGVVIFSSGGSWGLGAYFVLFAASIFLTAIFVAAAAAASAGAVGRERVRAIAMALVLWMLTAVLFDLAALGIASFLPSGHASRVLIVSVLVNPVDAIRTGALLATSGTTAFGAALLAFLRFTKGTTGAAIALTASVTLWTLFPALLATWRLRKRDL